MVGGDGCGKGERGGERNTGYRWENYMEIRIMHDLTRSSKSE